MAKQAGGWPPHKVSIVTEGTVLEGTLHTEGDVQISGRIVGNVTAEARLVVASAGLIDGEVVAAAADVNGDVQGDLEVARHLILRSGAHVEGTVKAGQLVVEDGAVFNGTCRMVPGEVPPAPPRPQSASRPKRQGRSAPSRPEAAAVPVPKPAPKAPAGGGKGLRRAGMALMGIVLVVIIASGAYYGFKAMTGATGEAVSAPSADLPVEAAEVTSEDAPGEDALYSVSETPPDDPDDFAAPIEAGRQAAGLDRITMERTRQAILNRSTEPEVEALFQQAEATRQTALRQFEDGNFEQAAELFRVARDLFDQIQQRLDEKDRALAEEEPPDDPPDAVTEDLAEATEEAPPDPIDEAPAEPEEEAPVEPVPEEDVEAALEEARTVVGRLTRQLKLSIEREDVTGMQALFYRGWAPFFDEAEAISAAVRYDNLQPSGDNVTADIYLDLAFQDNENQPQQRAQAYVWTLMRLGDQWVLQRVSSR